MLSPTQGWAVGDQGTILRYFNGTWNIYQGQEIPSIPEKSNRDS
jgi:hypothetical protein